MLQLSRSFKELLDAKAALVASETSLRTRNEQLQEKVSWCAAEIGVRSCSCHRVRYGARFACVDTADASVVFGLACCLILLALCVQAQEKARLVTTSALNDAEARAKEVSVALSATSSELEVRR